MLSLAHTWPLARDFTTKVVGGGQDVWVNTWQIWWVRQALVHLHNPFYSPLVHHPLGAQMYWHTLCLAKTAWGVLLLPFMRAQVAYNVLFLSCFVLTGYTSWLLIRYLLERAQMVGWSAELAAFAGACAFDFSRYHCDQALAHINLSSMAGMPLYLLFFFRYLDRGSRRDLYGVAAAALYTVLCEYYYIAYLATFSVVWLIGERWSGGGILRRETLRDPRLRRAGWVALSAFIAVSPVLALLLAHASPPPVGTHHGDSDYYVDLIGLLYPDRLSIFFAHLGSSLQRQVVGLPGNAEENGYWLGHVTVALASVAVAMRIPEAKRWAAIGVFYLLVACGIYLSIGWNDEVAPPWLLVVLFIPVAFTCDWTKPSVKRDTAVFLVVAAAVTSVVPITANGRIVQLRVPMPYQLFKSLVPLYSRGGMPNRLEALTTLSIAVLLAMVAARLGLRAGKRHAALGFIVPLLFAAVPNLEYANAAYPMADMHPAIPFFAELAKEPPDVAVFADDTVLSLIDQVQHGHPISAAHLSRTPVDELAMTELPLWRILQAFDKAEDQRQRASIARMVEDAASQTSPEQAEEMRSYLAAHRFKYFVAHVPNNIALAPFVTRDLLGQSVYRNSYIEAYRFPYVN